MSFTLGYIACLTSSSDALRAVQQNIITLLLSVVYLCRYLDDAQYIIKVLQNANIKPHITAIIYNCRQKK